MAIDCKKYPLHPPKIVATGKSPVVTRTNPFPDNTYLPGVDMRYGQDVTFGRGGVAPNGEDVGSTEAELKPKMRELVDIFARLDYWGMAEALVDKFLKKQSSVTFFEWHALNLVASKHPNIRSFCSMALSAPNSPEKAPPWRFRIHQALKIANWDINKIPVPSDLGPPAFNLGSKAHQTGDFSTGLGLMVNAIEYVYVVAENYHYDRTNSRYCIKLKYYFYDVFGLDDDDVDTYGSSGGRFWKPSTAVADAMIGITAWWQLQHQFNYAPLVTRIRLEQTFEVPTDGFVIWPVSFLSVPVPAQP